MSTVIPAQTLLGQTVSYPDRYDASVLQGIPRAPARAELGLHAELPFHGADIWRAYEVSWLNARGKPMIATATVSIAADSPCLIESKSFKLYLNSHNQTRYDSAQALHQRLVADLSACAQAPVQVALQLTPLEMASPALGVFAGSCVDDLDVAVEVYEPSAALLQVLPAAPVVEESLVSHLLRSNCPVTGQPDWGSVQISYRGPAIDPASLLRYIASYRTHTGFHEQCAEQIFRDVMAQCQPSALRVFACYTRRGGLDINPWRATPGMAAPAPCRTPRQ